MKMLEEVYVKAVIFRKLSIELEGELLAGSVVDKMNVKSTGQQIDDYNFGDHSQFNFDWEQ